jgi:hypothetical protein
MSDQLVQLRSYQLREEGSSSVLTVPPEAPDNFPVGVGDEIDVFADFEEGFVVYDFGSGGGLDGE